MSDIKKVIRWTRENLFDNFYKNKEKPSRNEIVIELDRILVFLKVRVTEDEKIAIIDAFLVEAEKGVSGFSAVTGNDVIPWVRNREAEEGHTSKYSDLYAQYLLDEGKIPSSGIKEIFDESDYILDRLEDPLSDKEFKKKGLVIGKNFG